MRLHVLEGLAADREEEGIIVLLALTLADDAATLIAALVGVAAALEECDAAGEEDGPLPLEMDSEPDPVPDPELDPELELELKSASEPATASVNSVVSLPQNVIRRLTLSA